MATSTIRMWGNVLAVRIPKAIAKPAGLEPGTPVTLTATIGGLLIRPRRRRRSYKRSDQLARCSRKNPHREVISGRTGKEVF